MVLAPSCSVRREGRCESSEPGRLFTWCTDHIEGSKVLGPSETLFGSACEFVDSWVVLGRPSIPATSGESLPEPPLDPDGDVPQHKVAGLRLSSEYM